MFVAFCWNINENDLVKNYWYLFFASIRKILMIDAIKIYIWIVICFIHLNYILDISSCLVLVSKSYILIVNIKQTHVSDICRIKNIFDCKFDLCNSYERNVNYQISLSSYQILLSGIITILENYFLQWLA